MLVRILGFGCNWWRRFGPDPEDRFRYTKHAAYFNSTGVRCGRKIRRHWVIPGLIRFNGSSNLAVHHVDRLVGSTFSCTKPIFALGGNRVVFRERASGSVEPDCYLVVVASERFGIINFQLPGWFAPDVLPLAASHLREKQESMLLMRLGDWIETDIGRWYLTPTNKLNTGATLQLAE